MEVAAYREPSVLGRKRAFGTRKEKTEVSIFGAVDDTERARQQRFRSELVAARGLLEKALAALSSPSSSPVSAPRVVRSEEPPAKKIKASPSPPVIKLKRKKMTRAERDLLAAGLAKLASELPDHIITLLKRHSRGISAGEMEIDIDSVEDEALLEIQQKLDEFVRDRADPWPQDHQDDGSMMAEEEEEDVDIIGGVSPLAIAPAPLQLAEDDEEYVDICGDASPAVNPDSAVNLGDDACDLDSDSGGNSDSGSCSDESQAEQDATLLMAAAKEYLERCRAREKARQEVLETERTATPEETETVHWTVLKSLHIVEYNMARPDSLLRQLGLFLKVDDYDISIEEQQYHHHCQSFQEDLEEGEIPA